MFVKSDYSRNFGQSLLLVSEYMQILVLLYSGFVNSILLRVDTVLHLILCRTLKKNYNLPLFVVIMTS